MPVSVGAILQAALLVANGMAVLNERRFLRRYGLGDPSAASTTAGGGSRTLDGLEAPAATPSSAPASSSNPFYAMDMAERRDSGGADFFGSPLKTAADDAVAGGFGSTSQSRAQLGRLLASVRMLLRWPLIIANIVCIIFTIIFG